MSRYWIGFLAAAVVGAGGSRATGEVTIGTVPVGHPGNPGELSGPSAGGYQGPDVMCGGVDYVFSMGRLEISAAQYTEFLNAVAAGDTYGLYNPSMAVLSHGSGGHGCNILRSGEAGSYTYSVAADWADRPVNYVSWGDAARFANWLHNGQPVGVQGTGTTESGAYRLNGAMTDSEIRDVVREPGATWVIPTEDEWYKAAYHKNDGATGNYWHYPRGTDSIPSNLLGDPDPGNNATFYAGGYTIGDPYYRTVGGAHENSESPYGTFDQGGNLSEWLEGEYGSGPSGCVRGGSAFASDFGQRAAARVPNPYSYETYSLGFRLAYVPEPGTLMLVGLGAGLVLRRRR